MEYESGGDSNYNWCIWNDPQRLSKGEWEDEPRPSKLQHY